MEDSPCLWIKRINFIKISIPKPIKTFNANKTTEIEKNTLKFTRNCRRPQIGKTILSKKKNEGMTLPNFKIYDKTIVTNTAEVNPGT